MEFKKIPLTEVVACIDAAKVEGKVPLILDRAGNVDTFLAYRHTQTLEAKKVLMDTITGGKSTEEVLEGMRKQLVAALKYGKYFHIRMTNSAVVFKGKFNSADCFPLQLFEPRSFIDDKGWEAVLRPEDKKNDPSCPIFGHQEHFGKGCQGEGFYPVITSTFSDEDYEEFLEPAIPLNNVMVFSVEQE